MATQDRVTPDGLLAAAKKPCVVVAHPDDETLWAGGLLVRYPGWTVICCTVPTNDPERLECFTMACGVLGAKPIALKQDERKAITVPDLTEYDLVVTHGPNGEYGHPQHMELHTKIAPDFWFAYGSDVEDLVIELTDDEWQRKLSALKCYNGKSPVDKNRPLWETLLEYFGNRFDIRREPYAITGKF